MAQEDLESARFGEVCMEESRKFNLLRQEQLLTATYHAIKLQSRFRGWCARCRCAIKRREQKRLWQEHRRAKSKIARREEFEEIAAQEAEAARVRAPTAEMIRSQELAAIVDDYNFNEDHSEAEEDSERDGLADSITPPARTRTKARTRTRSEHSVVSEDAVDKPPSSVEARDVALAPLDAQPLPSHHRFSLDDLFSGISLPSPVSGVHSRFEDCHQEDHTSPYVLQARKAAQEERFTRTRLKARSQAQAKAKARANQRTATRMLNTLPATPQSANIPKDMPSQQPRIQLTQSIKFAPVGEACESLRKVFANQLAERNEGVVKLELEIFEEVQDKYLECCGRYNAKPNSQVLEELRRSEPVQGDDGPEISYNFENAHVGDSGCVCLLHALALDPRIVSLCLRSCCLRGGSGPVLAVFIEMHAGLRDIDLSRNSLSYEFGELLLEALHQRSRLGPRKIKVASARRSGGPRGSVMGGIMGSASMGLDATRNEISVNLEGWFTGDVTDGYAVGPPCGNLWAGVSDNRSKLGPSGYEKLRNRLNNTDEVKFRSSDFDIADKPPSTFLDISVMSGGDKSKLRRGTARPPNKANLPDLQKQKSDSQKHKLAQQLVPIMIILPPSA